MEFLDIAKKKIKYLTDKGGEIITEDDDTVVIRLGAEIATIDPWGRVIWKGAGVGLNGPPC